MSIKALLIAFLLLPSYAWAEFPTTGVIDNFNRTNEGPPLGTGWVISYNGLKVISNQVAPGTTATEYYEDIYNTTFGPSVEFYFSIPVFDLASDAAYMYINVGGEPETSYSIYWSGAGEVGLMKNDTDTLDTAAVSAANNVKLGISYNNTTGRLLGFVDTGSGWTEVCNATDTENQNQAGIIVLGMHSTTGGTMRFDDFGGGNLTVSSPPAVTIGSQVLSLQ